MKKLTAKESHHQGPPAFQITACKKSWHWHEVFALKHSHSFLTLTVTRLGTWEDNKTSQQVSNHTLLSTAMETEAAVTVIHSTLSDQHFVWQMLTLKCLKTHCNQRLPNPKSQAAQIPKRLLVFPNNSQLSAFASECNTLQIPRKPLIFLALSHSETKIQERPLRRYPKANHSNIRDFPDTFF